MVTITGLLTIFLTSRRKIRSLALLDLAQARPGVAKTNSVSTCMSTKNMIIQSQPHLVLKEVQDLSQLRLVLMDNGAESKMPSMGKVSTSMVIMAIRAPTSTKTQSLPSSMQDYLSVESRMPNMAKASVSMRMVVIRALMSTRTQYQPSLTQGCLSAERKMLNMGKVNMSTDIMAIKVRTSTRTPSQRNSTLDYPLVAAKTSLLRTMSLLPSSWNLNQQRIA